MPTARRPTITRRNWVHRIDGVGGTRGGDEGHGNVLAAGIEWGAGGEIAVAAEEIVARTAAANDGGDGREGHGDWIGGSVQGRWHPPGVGTKSATRDEEPEQEEEDADEENDPSPCGRQRPRYSSKSVWGSWQSGSAPIENHFGHAKKISIPPP